MGRGRKLGDKGGAKHARTNGYKCRGSELSGLATKDAIRNLNGIIRELTMTKGYRMPIGALSSRQRELFGYTAEDRLPIKDKQTGEKEKTRRINESYRNLI